MKLTLEIWRQAGPYSEGHFETVVVEDAVPQMSILELLDHVNTNLVEENKEPFAFASDCREGICGTCGLMVNGRPHGPEQNKPSCQQRLLTVKDGDTLRIEPFRSAAYPVIKDMVVDRSALDRVLEQGGYVSINAGTAPDADTLHLNHQVAEFALDHAACIGCGACVAACPNGAAHLFTGAKLVHLSLMPLGKEERGRRARKMVDELETNFGHCSLYGECADVCPAGIPLTAVAAINKERARSFFSAKEH
ncbi:succinate dehydrogenase/fumarate reductase iron-sulfur subunit [Corynebacterium sp. 153RC1]|uniref:succinate dehydrogenase/fumarate reductase iron-sulfur subunit n=1 Tax=Corynebacterium TaxID=1716 RepID=UPI00211C9C52|nr:MULTISPECIES: succinate dehydrogenase/fumarate reductase iron-sulfur subunit [unclassified Corynebacterium]MCQ9370594.1 succinate dehydrogenase/fumarate reductase iron-sulfur subunit [Corynebacterium sp. 35RC1]MCQ9342696.1 succinate dehydrogenase/fumarate reductase iron-sulfur subunit [Corynebacterium sp. 76QC2CO]MCQ9351751.1 succinate dehydrogenase/fumarate reductase iron-sulfur subunit [Corynebacterium sp. 209RC1]MCQ9354487.1 succinate dehydrogenase/fumarate reductase iron-sulfur subunit [